MLMWCESAGMTVISVGVAKRCHFRNPVPAIPAKQTQLACGLMRGPRAEMLCYLIIESHVLSKAPSRTFKAIYNSHTHHPACTKQSQVCQTFTSKEAAQTVNFLWRYFFVQISHYELAQLQTLFCSFSHWLCSLFSLASHLFPSCCFPAERAVETPLLGCRSNSRPWDCTQESVDCITACGGRAHRFWLRGRGGWCVSVSVENRRQR